MADRIEVMFACNDPKNGAFVGRAHAIEFGERDVALRDDDGLSIDWVYQGGAHHLAQWVEVTGERYHHNGRRVWVGNWCWDSCELELVDARALLQRLLDLGCEVEEAALEGPFADLVSAHEGAFHG